MCGEVFNLGAGTDFRKDNRPYVAGEVEHREREEECLPGNLLKLFHNEISCGCCVRCTEAEELLDDVYGVGYEFVLVVFCNCIHSLFFYDLTCLQKILYRKRETLFFDI